MVKIIRLYADSVLVGLAWGIGCTVLLVIVNIAGLRDLVLVAPDGWQMAGLVALFAAGVISSVQFAVRIVQMELAEDRAVAWRKRNGWGRSPRDRKDRRRD